VALSPHLDDAVFSVGAYLRRQARSGVDVAVVTVLANDPDAPGAAGSWDALCGFRTAAAAARARREEDRRACAIIGARPEWLPYRDETYGLRPADDEIWPHVVDAIGGCDELLVPGWPLRHADHAWLTGLVRRRREELPCALRFYAEQPYATAATGSASPTTFARVRSAAADRAAKLRASVEYRSQLRPLGVGRLVRANLDEWRGGGERISPASADPTNDAPQ
jgi:LmbE family N-acetylglucosaminyl deacetylase